MRPVDEVRRALADEQAALAGLLAGRDAADGERPTRCPGWSVRHVVLHLAQSDELAAGSLTGRFGETLAGLTAGLPATSSVDEAAAAMVAAAEDSSWDAARARWQEAAGRLTAAGDTDLSARVPWVTGTVSARTLLTTRLAETWIHAGDVAAAFGVVPAPTERLRLVARLAWRTLPYAFGRAGRELAGPVAFHLSGPAGEPWDFVPDGAEAVTTVRGPAEALCAVAARRVPASATSLTAEGPDGALVLELVRTYA